ncbi:hypothetical protein ABZ172_04930 [Streptomyces sp. NPDC006296]|uniref:hypothetical protein n=1 Tax=Streptomyces sp. NPDC006296 TaxID=3156746 RepID=UPI0033A01701
MTTDPRILQLAQHRQRLSHEAYGSVARWENFTAGEQQLLLEEAATWLRAAAEAGIVPAADRPTPDHDAILLDNHGQIWGEYQTSPSSHGDALLRLVWASEQCSSKQAMEDEGDTFRLIGWSQ